MRGAILLVVISVFGAEEFHRALSEKLEDGRLTVMPETFQVECVGGQYSSAVKQDECRYVILLK